MRLADKVAIISGAQLAGAAPSDRGDARPWVAPQDHPPQRAARGPRLPARARHANDFCDALSGDQGDLSRRLRTGAVGG